MFPSRIETEVDGLAFSSNFCSGNLKLVTKGSEPNQFLLEIAGDGEPYHKIGMLKTWFYFSVEGLEEGVNYVFKLHKLYNQSKLYSKFDV